MHTHKNYIIISNVPWGLNKDETRVWEIYPTPSPPATADVDGFEIAPCGLNTESSGAPIQYKWGTIVIVRNCKTMQFYTQKEMKLLETVETVVSVEL